MVVVLPGQSERRLVSTVRYLGSRQVHFAPSPPVVSHQVSVEAVDELDAEFFSRATAPSLRTGHA
jgi:hypothetical protein